MLLLIIMKIVSKLIENMKTTNCEHHEANHNLMKEKENKMTLN